MSAQHKLLLFSAVLGAAVGLSRFAIADELPTLAQAGAPEGWYTEGEAAVGGQVFIKKPGDTPSNSAAKFNEYGDNTEPLFLKSLNFSLIQRDGSFRVDLHGANIGEDNQKLEADIEQPGAQYLTLGWYKTPQLRSNTAQTIFGGVGSTNLTVPSGVVQQLYNGIFNSTSATTNNNATYSAGAGANSGVLTTYQIPGATTAAKVPFGCFVPGQTGVLACKPGVTPVQTTINDNEHKINLGIERDRKEIDYRWTANEHWNIEVDYSNEHRFGTQEQGFLFSSSTTTPLAQVPMPIDDWTQDATISGEYAGLSPWGMNWNGMLRYNVSLYTDAFSSFSAENPFGGPGSPLGASDPLCPKASTSAVNNCYGVGQFGTAPDNGSQSVMGQFGVDLPGFKSNRYMATLQFTQMTQNQAFIPMTINGLGLTGAYPVTGGTVTLQPTPRNSLYGQIDTTLFNNVLATQLTPDLKNKLTYRYYDYYNGTPALTLANWIVNDSAIAGGTGTVGSGSYAPHTALLSAYTKQNASDELTWNPTKWSTIGAQTGWEQYRYSEYAANETNEYSEKLFGRINPTDWLSLRAEDVYSWRRYDNYNWAAFVGNLGVAALPGNPENPWLRDSDLANRNRNVANIYADITTPISGLTLTPTAGMRWDDYPSDPGILSQPGGVQLGLRMDHNWNAGLEADWTLNSNVSFVLSYTYEQIRQNMMGSSSGSNTGTGSSAAAYYSSDMGENVNTLTAGANFQLIPDRLALKLSGTYELAKDNWNTGPYFCPAGVSSANCGVATAGSNPAYPPNNTTFTHLDATLTYKFDPTFVMQLGKGGEAYLQLHYLWEREDVTNWQTSGSSTYMYSTLNSSTAAFKDMIFLAGDNPNYNAQAISASLVIKW
jgi:MtrB/PioB family decaheme-associated outer membrane protein